MRVHGVEPERVEPLDGGAEPVASTYGEVPASNLCGSRSSVERSKSTEAIMSPPVRNGGIASSSSRRPCSTPTPVGP